MSNSKIPNLTLSNLAKIIVKRQVLKNADTFIIIYGQPRTGKTVLGFDILKPYLRIMRRLHAEGKSGWEVPKKWSQLFRQFFATEAEDLEKKIKNNPERSFSFDDEGNDALSWQQQMEKSQQNLIRLILKTGKKKMLTIVIVPNLSLLTKNILARAKYFFMILKEPTKDGNYAYLFKNYDNPILAEKNPFGIKKIIEDLTKNPYMAESDNFEYYLTRKFCFVGRMKFKDIDPKLYALYDKMVKDPSINRSGERKRTISFQRFKSLQYAFDTLVYRLKNNDGKSISQIRNLLTDKFGTALVSPALISDHINRMTVLEKQPDIDASQIMEENKEVEIGEDEDLSLEEPETFLNAENQSNEKENQRDA